MTTSSKYWSDRHLIVGVEGPDGYAETVVEKPFARIGTHQGSEVVLAGKTAPWRAIYLHATPAGVLCVGLAETEAKAAPPPSCLQPEQTVLVGPYRISARMTGPAPEPRAAGRNVEGIETAPEMLVSVEDRELGRCRLSRRLVLVGRQPPSAIRLGSNLVSAVHCALYWDGDRVWAVDLLSSNGTTIDGQPIEVAALRPGDRLALGPVGLTYVAPGLPAEQEPVAADVEQAESDATADWQPLELAETPLQQAEAPLEVADDPLPVAEPSVAADAMLQAEREELERARAAWHGQKQRDEEALARRAAELEEEAARLTAERAEIERRATEQEASRQRTEQAQQQREQHDRDAALLDQRRAELDQAEAELAERVAAHEKQEGELAGRVAEWEAAASQRDEELAQRRAAMDDEGAQLADSRRALEEREKELKSRAQELDERSRQFEEEAREQQRSEASLAEQSAALEQARAELDALQRRTEEDAAGRTAELERQAAEIEQQRAALDAARTALEEDRAALEQHRAAWEAEQAEAEQKRQQWEAEAARHEEARVRQVAEFERRMAEIESSRDALRSEREGWQEERKRQKAELAEQDRHWQEASAALAARREQFEAARAAWDEKRRKAEAESDATAAAPIEPADEETPAEEPAKRSPSPQPAAALPTPVEPSPAPVARPGPAPAVQNSGWRRPVPRRAAPGPRWFLATLVGVLCAAAAGTGAWYAQQPKFTAVARLKLAPGEEWPMPDTPSEAAPALPEDLIAAPEQLVKCRSVVSAALASYDVSGLGSVQQAKDPAGWLSKAISVDTFSEKGFMRVTLRAEDPEAAKALLDAVVGVYVNRATDILREQRKRNLEKLDYQKMQAEMRLGTLKAQQLRSKAVPPAAGEKEEPTEKDPSAQKQQEAIDLAAQRKTLEAEAEAKTELLRGGELDEQQRQALQKELAGVRNELAMLAIRQRALSGDATSEPAAESSGGQTTEPVGTEIERTEQLLRQLTTERDQLQQRLSEAPISIVQPATLQEGESNSLRFALVLAAVVLGFLIPAWWLAPRRSPQYPMVPADWNSAQWPA